jgi:hypothetical protein
MMDESVRRVHPRLMRRHSQGHDNIKRSCAIRKALVVSLTHEWGLGLDVGIDLEGRSSSILKSS